PIVAWFERRGLGRVPAVLLIVSLCCLSLGVAGWAVVTQVTDLVNDLPRYKENVRAQISQLQGAGKHGLLATVQDFLDEFDGASRPGGASGPVVRVAPAGPSRFAQFQEVVGRLLGASSAALAVFLLVVCILLTREDLRNRLVRLAGHGRLVLTTRALDE